MSSEYLFTNAKLKKINVEKAINQNEIGMSVIMPPAIIREVYSVASINTSNIAILLKYIEYENEIRK